MSECPFGYSDFFCVYYFSILQKIIKKTFGLQNKLLYICCGYPFFIDVLQIKLLLWKKEK